jgi:hypothetical protein
LQCAQLRLSVRRASNNVPDHRFFTIGALYFLDIDRKTKPRTQGFPACGASLRFGYNTAPLEERRPGVSQYRFPAISGNNRPRPRIASQRAAGTKYASGASEPRFPEEFGPAAALRRHDNSPSVPAGAHLGAKKRAQKRGFGW